MTAQGNDAVTQVPENHFRPDQISFSHGLDP
jgi:hypothetical protein